MAVAERAGLSGVGEGGRPVVVLRMIDDTRAMIMHVSEQRVTVENASSRMAQRWRRSQSSPAQPARSTCHRPVLSLSLRSDRPTHPCHLQSLLMLIPAQLHSGVMRA